MNAEQLQEALREQGSKQMEHMGVGHELDGLRGQEDHHGGLGIVGCKVEGDEVGKKKGSRRSLGYCQGFGFFIFQ